MSPVSSAIPAPPSRGCIARLADTASSLGQYYYNKAELGIIYTLQLPVRDKGIIFLYQLKIESIEFCSIEILKSNTSRYSENLIVPTY